MQTSSDPDTPLRVALAAPCGDDVKAAFDALGADLTDLSAEGGPTAGSPLPEAFVVDLRAADAAVDAVRTARRRDLFVPVIAIVSDEDVGAAVEALRAGATEYLGMPTSPDELRLVLRRAASRARDAQAARLAAHGVDRKYASLVGGSPPMLRLLRQLEGLEDVDAPTVLIRGESGVGKDVVARAVHEHGPRADRPFVEVDCASIPEHLVESHLFGHERGAFTDAKELKRGLFELARGGTVFLDEIGELPLGTQAKLLRALENRRFKRVGGTVDLPLNAALLSATNRDLRASAAEGTFRGDLYYRLSVVDIEVPALRDRTEDIPALVDHFVERFNDVLKRNFSGADRFALRAMSAYSWPGNVRELRNVIERAMILHGDDDQLRVGHLPGEVIDAVPSEAPPPETATSDPGDVYDLPRGGVDLVRLEGEYVRQALERCEGNQTRAAALLGISRFALRHRAEKHGLSGLISTRRGRPKGDAKA